MPPHHYRCPSARETSHARAYSRNGHFLVSLLQTNKYLASITHPYFNPNPYDLSFDTMRKYQFNTDKSYFVLTRMLLSRPAIVDTFPDVLSVALKISESYFDYDDEIHAAYFMRKEVEDDEDGEEQDSEEDADEDADEDEYEEDYDSDYRPDSYEEDDIKPETPPSLDHLGTMRHLFLSKWQIDMEQIWPEDGGHTRETIKFKEYIKKNPIEQQRSPYFKSNLRGHYHEFLYQEAM